MASGKLEKASEIERQIFDCIDKGESFILDAGAGSGKTWTLVQTLNYVILHKSSELKSRNQKIVCITYTNVAKNEIIKRTEHNELILVSTIHEFLWNCIKNFQKELKRKLLEYIEEKKDKEQQKLDNYSPKAHKVREKSEQRFAKYQEDIDILTTAKVNIRYENFPNYRKGIVSHDDVIVITEKMFASYPRIRKITTDSYPMIFVDEYQDTQRETILILLDYLKETHKVILGFYGDKVQQIYDKGIGEIPGKYRLKLITKKENYRSSKEVIELLNNLRTDIQQYQPPQNTRKGQIAFYYHPNPGSFTAKEFVQTYLSDIWEIESVDAVKMLYLTHRFIAKENHYEELLEYYSKAKRQDCLIANEGNRTLCPFADLLFDIEEIVELYLNKRIQQFLKKISSEVDSFQARQKLYTVMQQLVEKRETKNIGEIITFVIEEGLLQKSSRMELYEEDEEKKEFYDKLKNMTYAQFMRLYQVQQDNTPFSTKHGTKGDEFRHVLVVIDDKAWNLYSFKDFFSKNTQNEERYKRTNNLFYVVCSRAEKNLAVVCVSKLPPEAIENVKGWFGEENYYRV